MNDLGSQKKRKLDEEAAAQDYEAQLVGPQLPVTGGMTHAQRVETLEQKLRHLRTWMAQMQRILEASNQIAVQNSRRLFVGALPTDVTQEELISCLEDAIARSGAGILPGNAISFCRIQPDKNFAFIEVRSAEEATNCLALDGICLRGEVALKIKRPSKFDAHTAMMLGPSVPDPTIDLRGLIISKQADVSNPTQQGRYERNWNTLYVGGLPLEWGEDQLLELLQPFGTIKYLKLMLDKETNKPRGYAFAEYVEDASTNQAISKLNGQSVGNRFITVNRLLEHKAQLHHSQQQQQPQTGLGGPIGAGMGRAGGLGNNTGGMGQGVGPMAQGHRAAGMPMQPGLGAGMAAAGVDMMGGQMGAHMGNQMGAAGMAGGMGQVGMGMAGPTMMPNPPQQQQQQQGMMGMNPGYMGQQGMYNQQVGGYGGQMGAGGYGQQQMGGVYGGQMGTQQGMYGQQPDVYGQVAGMGMGAMGAQQLPTGAYPQAAAAGMTGYTQDATYGMGTAAAYGQQGQMQQPQPPLPPPRPEYPAAPAPPSKDATAAGTPTAAAAGAVGVAGAQNQTPTGSQAMGGGMARVPGAWGQAPVGPMSYQQAPQYPGYSAQQVPYASYPGQV